MTLFLLSWFLAVPYWETVPAGSWTEQQLIDLLTESPWAQSAPDTRRGNTLPGPPVVIYLSSAAPMRQAEEEIIRRRFKQKPDVYAAIHEAREEYLAYINENAGKVIVVAIPLDANALADASETKRMEAESILRIGRSRRKMAGCLPLTLADA